MISLILLTLFFFRAALGQDDSSGCISLSTSTVCNAFSQFYIALPDIANDYPFLLNVTTIPQFDAALLSFVNSTQNYLFPLGCLSSNFNPTIPYARYSLTRLCATLIQDPSYSLPCNFNNGLNPPPLCQTACDEWVDSVTFITKSPRVCADSTQRNNTISQYQSQCHTWQGFNGTVADNCISGIANEPYTCGFGPGGNRIACQYCRFHSNDMCCDNISECAQTLSGGAIAGIVIGCVAVVALTVCLVYYYFTCYRKSRNPFQFMSASAAASTANTKEDTIASTNSNHDTSKIVSSPPPMPLSPISLEEKFYVVIHPYQPQKKDELGLNESDIVCIALPCDDGWAVGFNATTGQKGMFPIVCVVPASEESLEDLLNPVVATRSLSIASTAVPHRSIGSFKHDDYMEIESPSSPTLDTPFFRRPEQNKKDH